MPSYAEHVGAVILAAGIGRRIGGPKALLSYDDATFVEHMVHALRAAHLRKLTIVSSELIYSRIAPLAPDCRIVINPDPDGDMLSSLRLGVAAAADVDGVIVVPVDHPFVRSATYQSLTDAFLCRPGSVIIPEYRQKRGHPVLIPRFWAEKQLFAAGTTDLNSSIKHSGVPAHIVAVDDPGILRNINTPSDLPAAGGIAPQLIV